MNKERVNVIGVPISAVNLESAINNIFEDLGKTKDEYICVADAHVTVIAHNDPNFRRIVAESFMSVPDGKPLSVVGKKEFPDMDRVKGLDLMRSVFMESKERNLRHFFYGSRQETLEEMTTALRRDYPWLNIVGIEPSVFRDLTEVEEEGLAERINATEPDFVWVALGAPRQEKFCYRMKGRIQGLMVGVGGAFNVLAGRIPEAPKWMQNMSLEWFYRFLHEPRRLFKRYIITIPKFLWYHVTKKKAKS